MIDERIDILNDDLTVIKTCLKSDAHKNGWFHASVHVWLYTDDGKILLQKRSPDKIAFPDLWDVSVAGHISAGEDAITSALREIEEEIGLTLLESDLFEIGNFKEKHQHKKDFIDNEIHLIYIGKLCVDLNQLKIQEEELTALKLISIKNFKKALSKPNFDKFYVPHYLAYYDFVLSKIQTHL